MIQLDTFSGKPGPWKADLYKINQFVFKVALPVMLFEKLARSDFRSVWDLWFVMFYFVVTLCSIGLVTLISLRIADRPQRGEFIQAAYCSSASLLGIAFTKICMEWRASAR